MKLYHYWRSSSSWRVRWALDYKKIDYDLVSVNLLNDETDRPEFRRLNPLGFVPVLEIDGKILTESVAIIEWINEWNPDPQLYPVEGIERAHCRALIECINAGIQPVQNLSVQEYYSDDPVKRKEWAQHFITQGFVAFEKLVKVSSGKYCMGDQITAADLFLVPQVYNALRNDVDVKKFPLIHGIYQRALETPACQSSHPDKYKPS